MSTKSTEFLHIWHRMPVHKTHDFSAISYFRKVSQAATHDGGCHRATFSWAQNLVRVPPERVHSVFNHPWGDKPANNKETYGQYTLGAGSDLSRTFFLITCTTSFTRLLTAFRRYIQRFVSMSIADGLASTNLLLLYIPAIYLHIYVLCFENTRYIWIRQRMLVTWYISHVRAAATIMFMVVRYELMTGPIWTWTRDIGSQSVHNQSLTSQEKTDIDIGLNKTRHDKSHHGNVFRITDPLWGNPLVNSGSS